MRNYLCFLFGMMIVSSAGTVRGGELKAGVATVDLTPPLEWGYTLGATANG